MKLTYLIVLLSMIYNIKTKEFECTNGKDPSKMTDKEYLIEFSKGNCSPIMVVPPLTGVRLYV